MWFSKSVRDRIFKLLYNPEYEAFHALYGSLAQNRAWIASRSWLPRRIELPDPHYSVRRERRRARRKHMHKTHPWDV